MWIMVASVVFMVFSLVYRPEYISYGFITLTYSLVAHTLSAAYDKIYKNEEIDLKIYRRAYLIQFGLMVAWVAIIICMFMN